MGGCVVGELWRGEGEGGGKVGMFLSVKSRNGNGRLGF